MLHMYDPPEFDEAGEVKKKAKPVKVKPVKKVHRPATATVPALENLDTNGLLCWRDDDLESEALYREWGWIE